MKRVSKNFLGDFASRDENKNICYRTKSPPPKSHQMFDVLLDKIFDVLQRIL